MRYLILNMLKIHGGVYGIFQGNNYIYAIVSATLLYMLYFYAKDMIKESKLKSILWQFVFAGGVSNLIDRIFKGYVVDFIQMKFFGIFNVADAFIVISISIIIILEIKEIFNESNRSGSNRKSGGNET